MHFYSEAPITSFFPRITASKKRKIYTEGSVSNNKQRDHTSRQGIKSKAKEEEPERRNTLENGAISVSHPASVDNISTTRPAKTHMSLLNTEAAIPQLTPKLNRLPSRRNRKISLPTPPQTNEGAKRQRLMELTPPLSPFIFRKSLDLSIEKVLLPTPSTLGRSASHNSGHTCNDRCPVVQGQDLLSPTRPKHSDTSMKASVPVSIPSSQSQLMAKACELDLTPAGTAFPRKRLQSPQHEAQLKRIPLNKRDNGHSISHTSQMFISSSQSQFLTPIDGYDHLQKSQPRLTTSNSEFDIIPSSQSQEKELRILSDPEGCHQSIRSRKQALPQRTLSDELFSVSILQTGWSDSSLDPHQPIQGTGDIPPVANHDDDSATESESELETEDRDHRLTPIQSKAHGSSRLSTADFISLNDSQDKDSRTSQQSPQDLSPGGISSPSSLPNVVKEFQSMFGSEDESYPPDFPMSLR